MKTLKVFLEIISYMTTILFNVLIFTNTASSIQLYSSAALMVVLFFLFRLWHVADNHKKKIIAMKKFYDYMFVDIANHINREVKDLEIRCEELEKSNGTYKEKIDSETEKLADERELSTRSEKMNEYNTAFDDWACGNIGKGTLQTMYKKFQDFKTKLKTSQTQRSIQNDNT